MTLAIEDDGKQPFKLKTGSLGLNIESLTEKQHNIAQHNTT